MNTFTDIICAEKINEVYKSYGIPTSISLYDQVLRRKPKENELYSPGVFHYLNPVDILKGKRYIDKKLLLYKYSKRGYNNPNDEVDLYTEIDFEAERVIIIESNKLNIQSIKKNYENKLDVFKKSVNIGDKEAFSSWITSEKRKMEIQLIVLSKLKLEQLSSLQLRRRGISIEPGYNIQEADTELRGDNLQIIEIKEDSIDNSRRM